MPILKLKDLTSGYGKTVIIREINLSMNKGEILAILGRNGVGKSTLLKTIMGVNGEFSGEVYFEDQNINDLKPYQIETLGIAYAPQESALFPQLTVDQNLKIGLKKGKKEYTELSEFAFSYFPVLKERLKQKAGTLSGGEQKMLLMSRAIVRKPKLMVLDEITEGVQPSVIDRIGEAIHSVRKQFGTSIVLVEQNINFANSVGDYYAVMNQGEIRDFDRINGSIQHKVEKYITV
jgi:ABC-type branched-subunit amino acid transport system ATPase component